ncbi:MAG: outer membrane beta-barrel protein [Endomicrobium sp.]|nr:outer membrane beta-barrel protein [Endomicrobium sp.]
MKKVTLLLFVFLFFAGMSFAESEVNLKLGLDPSGKFKAESSAGGGLEPSEFGVNLSGEYLYRAYEILRVGAGLEYLFPRGVDIAGGEKYSWLPFYATVLVNPLKSAPGLYLKGNIGYSILFNVVDFPEGVDPRSKKGGIYWALGAGYEFGFGLVFEAMYGSYSSSYNRSEAETFDLTYGKFGINIGYKFNFYY